MPQEDLGRLAAVAKRQGISRSELIRRALHRFAQAQQTQTVGFGVWHERGVDGLDYQESLRNEWERHR